MSTVWKLEKDLCRCCHSEGSFHNLLAPRLILGQEEYYLEMLRQSFGIELEQVPGVINELTFTICESCIIRLRDAANFKQQVLLCEKRFKDVYKDILRALTPSEKSPSVIKVEVPSSYQQKLETPSTFQDSIKVEITPIDEDDDDFQLQFDDEDNETLLNIKKEDAKKATPKAKKSTATAKKKRKSVCRQVKKKKNAEAQDAEPEAEAKVGERQKKGETRTKFFMKETDFKLEGEGYVCAHCNEKLQKYQTLRNHVKRKHYNIIPKLGCPFCEKKFVSLAPLNTHKLEEHNINSRFKCKACSAEYNERRVLASHINVYHMQGEKRKCEHCEFETFSKSSMRRHMIKHKTVKEFHCRFCNKSFLRKNTLNFHERIHTGDKRKVCKECGQAFVQKASLNYHMAKYHPEVNF